MNLTSESQVLLDSAAGPLKVTTTEGDNFDIDDYVHLMVLGMGNQLRLFKKVRAVNPTKVTGRPPVATPDGTVVGGF